MAARQGERHHFALLTERQVIKLRQQPQNLGHYHKLCSRAHPSTVQRARHGETWRHLDRLARPVKVRPSYRRGRT